MIKSSKDVNSRGLYKSSRTKNYIVILPLLLLMALTTLNRAFALEFEFINGGDKPLDADQMKVLHEAAADWQKRFPDPITVRINVGWKEKAYFDGLDTLASVRASKTTVDLDLLLDTLKAEARPGSSELAMLKRLQVSIPFVSPLAYHNRASIPTANAKALGIAFTFDPRYGEILDNYSDAQIYLNYELKDKFFYSKEDYRSDKYDFRGVIKHEIAHALGFTSVVDLQAVNSTNLYPSLLDLFRFPEIPSYLSHNIATDTRLKATGPAEFFDGFFRVPFSNGLTHYDSDCLMGFCSASHWSDSVATLMTSAKPGKELKIQSEDEHAVDRVGVDSKWRNGIPVLNAKLRFFRLADGIQEYSDFDFKTKNIPPNFASISRPSWVTNGDYGLHISMDGHAGSGYAVFLPAELNTKYEPIEHAGAHSHKDVPQWEVDQHVHHMSWIPPRITHFYFESSNGTYSFAFNNLFSNFGSVFDPHLGKYGGFRISGYLNGNKDAPLTSFDDEKRRKRDIDATVTLLMVLEEPYDLSKGLSPVGFSLLKGKSGEHVVDNIAHIVDGDAFSLPYGYNNSDSYSEALEQRVERLVDDPAPGYDVAF